ncbi:MULTISPECIES: ABC transporter substrate-binding protein [unclassified Methanoregula]|uniref:ABC transporter substrate-binding protein n=1 Tax=unclassified Methanoregula TaxID=2649730 RepID=UPI0009D45FA6|nr:MULTISPECIES: ABC transporter substrate-binding protein [unclassified Methanoregula]OPX62651.1 MAG: NMT1/THI5 like protein [Methanoregula sp. PtaB.Bin085]OPY33304.1 MAG: NMT1/THI5 like protein [Methanoregula sp. PtaU1.Bin006]
MADAGSIRIGHLSTLYHTAFLLRGSEILHGLGIRADWRLFASGPDIINAMEAGTLDLGYIGLPPVIIGIGRGLPLACIAGGHVEGTIIVGGPGTRTFGGCGSMRAFLSQCAGKAIGTPPQGSIHDVIVRELLREHGIADVEVRNYPWADFLADALGSGEIACAAGTPALAVTARRYGNARLVVPPDQLWPFNPSYGIVVMREMLEQEGLLLRFLAAHEQACERIRHDPAACARTVAATTGMVDEAFVQEAYRISPKYCAALPREYIESTMRFVPVLHTLGYIPRPIGEKEIFEPSLIARVHPGRHHYSDGMEEWSNLPPGKNRRDTR